MAPVIDSDNGAEQSLQIVEVENARGKVGAPRTLMKCVYSGLLSDLGEEESELKNPKIMLEELEQELRKREIEVKQWMLKFK